MPTTLNSRGWGLHVADEIDEVPAADVARTKAGGAGVNLRQAGEGRIFELPVGAVAQAGKGVGEGGLDALGERVGLGEGIVHALDHGQRLHVPEGLDELGGGERGEAGDMHDAHLEPEPGPHVIGGGLRGFHHPAHADQRVVGVLHPVGVHHAVAAAGPGVEGVHGLLHGAGAAVVVEALGDLALHVGVLVLHHAGHDGGAGVKQAAQLLVGVPHEFLHELGLRQEQVLDGVRGEEAVLHVHEGRLAGLGGPAADERQVAGLLRVAPEERAPARVRHAHDVVMAAVHVE
jgi:hypothetical protein